ncbi:MAG TPA: 50S ribosomal protein L4 [Methanomassiliicoccales archaeon]|nr:50S ribosomal protein L4 [Methanomassiliicoccales archaeon]HQM66258.1 50S ribosomal protein L4 [Methanomassiliicoccales archaeon]
MSKVNVYSLSGEVLRTEALPKAFSTQFRPDVIHRAVVAEEANKRQPYGPKPGAGARHSVSTWGKGRGVARVQRLAQGAKAAESPNNVGGRRAHPPRVERDWSKKVNRKEKALAKMSALAATADAEKVRARGHRFKEGLTLPVVIEDRLEGIESTTDVLAALRNVGVSDDIARAKDGIRIRAGRGKMRGRPYRMPRSLLLVVSVHDAAVVKGARNLPGVEVAYADRLNPGLLAPGGMPGRLTVFTESALKKIGEW